MVFMAMVAQTALKPPWGNDVVLERRAFCSKRLPREGRQVVDCGGSGSVCMCEKGLVRKWRREFCTMPHKSLAIALPAGLQTPDHSPWTPG